MLAEAALQPSDEEILGYDSEAQSVSEDSEDVQNENDVEDEVDARNAAQYASSQDPVSEEDEPGENLRDWGTTRDSYYNVDAIETEADALEEEAEAKRLQQKRLQDMTEADYGFDEAEWADAKADGEAVGNKKIVKEQLPDLMITDDMDKQDRLKILKSRYPEFDPLTRDFVDLEETLEELRLAAEARTSTSNLSRKRKRDETNNKTLPSTSVALTKWRALSAYLGSIAMYLAVLTSTASKSADERQIAMVPRDLHSHPIIDSVFKCRQLWEKVKDIPTPTIEKEHEIEIAKPVAEPQINSHANAAISQPREKRKKLNKSQKAAKAAKAEAEKKRADRMAKAEADLADLSSLLKSTNPNPTAVPTTRDLKQESDFGDEAPLTAAEAAEKARKKKSLRFYTSQIAQKANKRGEKARDAGGDTDLPYKERVIDKRERLNREAEKKGRGKNGTADLEEGDNDDDEQARIASEVRNGYNEEDNEIFDYMAARKSKKAVQKASRTEAFAEASAQASKSGARLQKAETTDEDGRRKISYQIRSNKGLTPKRKKENRNPRTKKRGQFLQKQKKLASMRAVYKGGEGRGGYGGELTGINRNVVKSVKL